MTKYHPKKNKSTRYNTRSAVVATVSSFRLSTTEHSDNITRYWLGCHQITQKAYAIILDTWALQSSCRGS